MVSVAQPVLDTLPLTTPVALTQAADERAALWTVRKALYTPPGPNATAFPVVTRQRDVEAEVRASFERMATRLRDMALAAGDSATVHAAIEGNTDATKTREGGGVYRLARRIGEINRGFIAY